MFNSLTYSGRNVGRWLAIASPLQAHPSNDDGLCLSFAPVYLNPCDDCFNVGQGYGLIPLADAIVSRLYSMDVCAKPLRKGEGLRLMGSWDSSPGGFASAQSLCKLKDNPIKFKRHYTCDLPGAYPVRNYLTAKLSYPLLMTGAQAGCPFQGAQARRGGL